MMTLYSTYLYIEIEMEFKNWQVLSLEYGSETSLLGNYDRPSDEQTNKQSDMTGKRRVKLPRGKENYSFHFCEPRQYM